MTTKYSPHEICGSQAPLSLRTINRLREYAGRVSEIEGLSEVLSDVVELLECRLRAGEEDAFDLMMSTWEDLTISEIQELNRESLFTWPLGILNALIDCGIEPSSHPTAQLQQRVSDENDVIDLVYFVVEGRRVLGRIALHTEIDGACRFVCTGRQRVPDWAK